MITILVLIRRKDGTTREEFSRYWRYEHAELTKTVPDFWRNIRKYVQYHHLPADQGAVSHFGEMFDYDGVGQMWFDSVEAMTETFQHPGYKEIIQPHEANFVNMGDFKMFVAEEVVKLDLISTDVVD